MKRMSALSLLVVGVVVSGCASVERLVRPEEAEPGPVYPMSTERDRVRDIQVFREETELILTNTTAEDFESGGRLWVNAEYSMPIESLPIGETRRLDLREFVNEYGERFRAGGFFATERPDGVVLVEMEHKGRLDGLVLVRGGRP